MLLAGTLGYVLHVSCRRGLVLLDMLHLPLVTVLNGCWLGPAVPWELLAAGGVLKETGSSMALEVLQVSMYL